MIVYCFDNLLLSFYAIVSERRDLENRCTTDGDAALFTDAECKHCEMTLRELNSAVARFYAPSLKTAIGELESKVTCSEYYSIGRISENIREIIEGIFLLFDDNKFAHISKAEEEYFEKENIFTEPVHRAFPVTCANGKDIGNCIAIGAYNAAIHELLRVAERALRIFGRYCRIPQSDMPIEYMNWGTVTTRIKDRITAPIKDANNQRIAPSPKLISAREFCVKANQNAILIEKGWRNESAHNRANYTLLKVLSLMAEIKSFLLILAENGIGDTTKKRIPER
jgi:hypothetical protein